METVQAPPATVFRHARHFQIPTASRFTVSCASQGPARQSDALWLKMWRFERTLPQKVQVYLACCVISIFLICLRNDAPYRVPYLPVTPTFFVRLVCKTGTKERKVSLGTGGGRR